MTYSSILSQIMDETSDDYLHVLYTEHVKSYDTKNQMSESAFWIQNV